LPVSALPCSELLAGAEAVLDVVLVLAVGAVDAEVEPDADVEPPTSAVENELSSELNTATLALLISVVPSAGSVETG
jgi:hypothetical protein